ncbi:uncharacterized protein G2W53_000889 [Senna tora]|uniref:Uncharacterized protein n=1 Tax=Senna tora TaxID=362788 RepID=A0A834XEV5_9FABA|nr:uncharacterized protein G2W53_000889 [Senna tora]
MAPLIGTQLSIVQAREVPDDPTSLANRLNQPMPTTLNTSALSMVPLIPAETSPFSGLAIARRGIEGPKIQWVENSGLLGLVQTRSKGNLAYVKNFYFQAKLHGWMDDHSFRGQPHRQINLEVIRTHYNLPDHPTCTFTVGERDKSLIRYEEIGRTLCIAGKKCETKEEKNRQSYNRKRNLMNYDQLEFA